MTPFGSIAGVLAVAWLPVAAQTLDVCSGLYRHGRLQESQRCYQGIASSSDPYIRAEAYWALGRYEEANDNFRKAVAAQPRNANYRVRWGRLYLDRMQPKDAADLFGEALEIENDNPGAFLGLALIAAENFDAKGVELAQRALKKAPKLVEAQSLLARMALEDNDPRKAVEEADKALAMDPEALEAMAIRASVDWLDDKPQTPWEARALKVNPAYGELYATAGRFLMLNRRYEESVKFLGKAIELNPRLHKARAELGLNLMRLGQDQEAKRHLEICFEAGERYAAVVNPLTLIDSYKKFKYVKSGNTVLKLHERDAELLQPYFETELKRAIATFEKKYKMGLDRPVQLEAYPDHDDFAVRTLGMPGMGALGVTFGYVVAMDSPSGRKPGEFHWASTLWHELSHVFTLAATNNRIPRWFTEGMAVYEETAASPEWGDRLTPPILAAIRDKKLLPVAQLDRGFVHPSYPEQVLVSYFQAGRICQFIVKRWGFQKLLDMMQAFGRLETTPQVIERQLGLAPAEFDKQFLESVQAETKKTVEGFDEWKKGMRRLAEAAEAGNHDQVLREAPALRDIYPDYIESGNAYELLAASHLAKGDKAASVAELQRYARAGGRNPATLKRLAALLEESGNSREAAAALERINYIYPRDEELHRKLGDLYLAGGDSSGAIREFRALLAVRPQDQAGSHYSLARAYRMANRTEEAREHVLMSLEAAPGYRPAQKLLLELSR